ncbi:TPA: DUF3265 domain-containing protein [Vibrio vulnificus]|nr:DUF3265 domain-containing protein [Vibrio vulnificus]
MHLTRRSSGIHAAWHFGFAVSFGGESGLRKVGLSGIHPLTQRYANIQSADFPVLRSRLFAKINWLTGYSILVNCDQTKRYY